MPKALHVTDENGKKHAWKEHKKKATTETKSYSNQLYQAMQQQSLRCNNFFDQSNT